MKKIIFILLILLLSKVSYSQNYLDTINCTIAYRIDTGKYGFLYRSDYGDQVFKETKFILMRDAKFTDTGFNLLNDSIGLNLLNEENHFKLFSKKYKRYRSKKQRKEFKDFEGFDFYLLQMKIVISNYRPTSHLHYIWPSNDKNLTYVKQGTVADIIKILEIKPCQVPDTYFLNWKKD